MNNELRRILELSGQSSKNGYVASLYENHGVEGESVAGFEGPFKMKSGRTVHYSVTERKFYDAETQAYLTGAEETALSEDNAFTGGVVLSATRGEEKLSLRLESMMAIKPMVTMLRNNGYEDFSHDGEVGDDYDAEMPAVDQPEGECAVSRLQGLIQNAQHVLGMVSKGDVPGDVEDQIAQAAAAINSAHDALAVSDEEDLGNSDMNMDHDPIDEPVDVDASAPMESVQTVVEYAKGDKVVYNGKEVTVTVPDAKGDQVGIDKGDGKVDLVDSDKLSAVAKKDDGDKKEDKKDDKKSSKVPPQFQKGGGKKDDKKEDDDDKVEEAAVSATVFDNTAMPANAVDDDEQKAERTGRQDRTETKNKVPTDVIKAIDKRLAEIKKSIERYDGKGYNEGGVKPNTVDALEQIKRNLGRGDHEGFMEAQIFYNTLMSPITDMIPGQVVNYLAKGDDINN